MRLRGVGPVLVVEEQELFRKGLRAALEKAGLPVAGEYGSAAAALQAEVLSGKAEPGTVILCSLGIEGWQELVGQAWASGCPSLGIVDQVTDQIAIESLSNGVLYCLERRSAAEEWVQTIKEAASGGPLPSRMVLRHPKAAQYILMSLPDTPSGHGLHPLTPVLVHRERLVLSNISEGVLIDHIAQRSGLEEVEAYEALESACLKLVARHRLLKTLAQFRPEPGGKENG